MEKILFLDIDNTLLIPQNIYIYYQNGDIFHKFTPEEYAKLDIDINEKKYFNYHEFRDEKIIKHSIKTSKPIQKSLNIIKTFLKNDYQLGIITARGKEDVISEIIPNWLKNQLKMKFILKRENIYCINDFHKKYKGDSDSYKKLNILKEYSRKKIYKKIAFMEDNLHTILMIEKHNQILPLNRKINLIYVNWNN